MKKCISSACISVISVISHFLIGLSFKILMEKWLRQVKIGQNGSNLPKSKPSFLKKRGKNSFAGSKGPSVLRLAQFQGLTSSDYISRMVECSMILLWGVKSRSSLQTDAERGSPWAASHWGGCFHLCLRELEWASYSSGNLQVWWGNGVIPDRHIIVLRCS